MGRLLGGELMKGRKGSGLGPADGVAVDDEGDLAVREHGAAGERGTVAELGRERPRDELALADERLDREREAALAAPDDDGEAGLGGRLVAERAGEVDE